MLVSYQYYYDKVKFCLLSLDLDSLLLTFIYCFEFLSCSMNGFWLTYQIVD